MKKATKICIIVASSLILAGIIIFVAAMSLVKWDFSRLSTSKIEKEEHEISKAYENICIKTDTADIEFVTSENGTTSVVCLERENEKHSVRVDNNTLVIELENTKKWYEYIGINFDSTKITVYLPEAEYGSLSISSDTGDIEIPKDFIFDSIGISESTGDVVCLASARDNIKIKTSTGDIELSDLSAAEIDLTVSTGDISVSDVECKGNMEINVSTGKSKLNNVKCKSIISDGDTGDMILTNVIAEEKFSIERSTGDVTFDLCDASEIDVETDTGNVNCLFLTEKVVIYETDTGDVIVPHTTSGALCEITTDTGDITVKIRE